MHRDWTHIICLAGGPSLSHEQVQLAREARPGWKILVCNNTWERIPDADILYAGDQSWWRLYGDAVDARFKGEIWTGDRWTAARRGYQHIQVYAHPGLARAPNVVHSGGNSGYVMLGLAYHFGAKHIILCGFDMQDTGGMSHWHGDHPLPLTQGRNYEAWISAMNELALELAVEGVHVINCTTTTALSCFEQGELAACLSP